MISYTMRQCLDRDNISFDKILVIKTAIQTFEINDGSKTKLSCHNSNNARILLQMKTMPMTTIECETDKLETDATEDYLKYEDM